MTIRRINREGMVAGWIRAAAIALLTLIAVSCSNPPRAPKRVFEVNHTTSEWIELLSPSQYRIMRLGGTERAFSSHLNHEHCDGYYVCAADSTILFTSPTKFNSGTGWPSFSGGSNLIYEWDSYASANEVRCGTCGSHLGHLFKDGKWTNSHNENRYCINGDALIFISTE